MSPPGRSAIIRHPSSLRGTMTQEHPRPASRLRFLAPLALTGLLAMPAAYLLAALALGLLPANRDWQAPVTGIPIYLDSNGVHTGLVLPMRNSQMDWSARFPPRQILRADRFAASPYIAIGWGSRTFFLQTQTWADLTPGKALAALASDDSVLHVEYQPQPSESANTRKMLLTPGQYAKLVDFISQSMPIDADGKPLWLKDYHYDGNDAFYQANGNYNPLMTCNQWTRNALNAAGVRTALWSPFGQALLWHAGS
ncbi:TIGR02117 family protein [Chromobacterium sphagni]|nr:TIGR02117 family protein [Chromobacterium sphagni]